MTKRCIICRKEASRGYTFSCSFHTFPKDEVRRKKWIEALNLQDVSYLSTKIICSDHFDRKSFYYSDELRRRQRLRPEAVPQITNLESISSNSSKYCRLSFSSISNLENIDYKSEETNVMLNENCRNEEPDIEIETEISIKEESVTSMENPTDECCSTSQIMVDISNQSNKAETEQDIFIENAIINKSMNNDSSRSESFRQYFFPNGKQPQQVRFKDGYETKYMFRQDFVSNEAWDRFLRLMTYERSKLAIAHNKNSRKEKEVRSLKLLIKELEKIISNLSPIKTQEIKAAEI